MDLGTRNSSTTTKSAENVRVSVWIPITVILSLAILSAVMVLCSHKLRRLCRKNIPSNQATTSDINAVQMTLNVNDRSVPETPPPAYASLERQFSYVSHISQNSSQIEIPPDYDEITRITTRSYPDRELALQVVRGAGDDRIFRRSISALENRSPSKTSTLEMHISSSVVIPNTSLDEDNEALEASCSMQINTGIPDVIKETSPRNEQLQKNYISRDSNGQIESTEVGVVFSISEDSQSLQEYPPETSSQNFQIQGNTSAL